MKKIFFTKRIAFMLGFAVFCAAAFPEIYLGSADDALKAARAFCPEYELQRKYVSEQVRLAKKSVGAFLPSFEFSWSESDTVQIGSDDYRTKSIGAGITQKLFDGGKSIMEYKMQINKSKFEFYGFKKSLEEFERDVVRSYYQNLLAKAKCRVQSEALENAKKILSLAAIQMEQGMITKYDYIKTEISCGQIELQLKTYIDEANKAERELESLLGSGRKESLVFNQEEILPEEISIPPKKTFRKKQDYFVNCAIDNSIELKQIDTEIDWAKKQRAIQKMVLMPSVSVNGGIEFYGKHYPLTTPSYKLKVIVGFENNPWLPTKVSGGASFKNNRMNSIDSDVSTQGIINTTYFSELRMSKINLSQKVLTRQKAARKIEDSVLTLLESLEQTTENLSLNFEMLKLKEKNIALQQIQLAEGQIKKTDFLDALTEFAEQKIQVLELRNQFDYLQKQLEITTGKGGTQ